MRQNITKVSQRGEQLDSLQDKTDNLAVSAQGFRRGANRVRKQMWWKDMKMRVCLIIAVIVLILVIVIPAGKFLFVFVLIYLLFSNRFNWITDFDPLVSCRNEKKLGYDRKTVTDKWVFSFWLLFVNGR